MVLVPSPLQRGEGLYSLMATGRKDLLSCRSCVYKLQQTFHTPSNVFRRRNNALNDYKKKKTWWHAVPLLFHHVSCLNLHYNPSNKAKNDDVDES